MLTFCLVLLGGARRSPARIKVVGVAMDKVLTVLVMVWLSAGCTLQTRVVQDGGEEVIRLRVSSDPQLNRYEKSSHALLLCLYQLKEPGWFRQLAEDREGLPKLLECDRFDASVAHARRIVVQPGQEVSHSCDKAEGARYLGLVGGYYSAGGKKVTQLIPLPASPGGKITLPRLFRVHLGAQEIANARVE